jgi:hypothetical protein
MITPSANIMQIICYLLIFLKLLTVKRKAWIYYDDFLLYRSPTVDSRVHACLYFIAPSGHGLKSLDIEASSFHPFLKGQCHEMFFVKLSPPPTVHGHLFTVNELPKYDFEFESFWENGEF